MEILKIESAYGLTTTITTQRPVGAHTYKINTRQFQTVHRDWQRHNAAQGLALGVMTLDYERIWMTTEEVEQVAAAIQSVHSPLTLSFTTKEQP